MFTWTEGRTDVQTDRQTYSESNNHVLAIFLCGYTKKEVMSGCIACIGGVRNAFRLLTGITQETFVSWTPINWREETVAWSLCLVKIIFTCQMGISSTAEGSWCAKEQIQFVDWRPTRNRRPFTGSGVASVSKYREQFSSFFKWHSNVSLPEIPADYCNLGTKYWQAQ